MIADLLITARNYIFKNGIVLEIRQLRFRYVELMVTFTRPCM